MRLFAASGKAKVRGRKWPELLSPLTEELDIEWQRSRALPSLDAAQAFLMDRFM